MMARLVPYPAAACSNAPMSIFFIWSIAFIALRDFAGSGSLNSLTSTVGMICQERPYLSFSQPHCCAFGSPPRDSLSQ
jgi:hypothetical protein